MEEYESLLVPNLKVSVANYITEFIISVKHKNKSLPKVEYWQKKYEESFKELQTEYIAELTQVKKLLKVFSPDVLIKYFKSNKMWTLRYLKKEQSKELIYNLFIAQYQYIQDLKDIKKSELEIVDNKIEYIEQSLKKSNNAISKGL